MWGISVSLFLITLTLWFLWRKRRFSTFKRLGIPGPEPNIVIGNLWEMLKSSPLECHEKWIKQYGKVVGHYPGGTPVLIVADVDLAKKILVKDFHKFPNRPFLRNNSKTKSTQIFSNQLISLTDKRWKEVRSIITPSFTTSKMRMMTPLMKEAVDSLMNIMEKNAKAGNTFDIYELYRRLTLDIIGRSAFGIHTDVQNNQDDPIIKAMKLLTGDHFNSIFTILTTSFPEFRKFWRFVSKFRFILKGSRSHPIRYLVQHAKEIIKLRRQNKNARRSDLLQNMMDSSISESSLKNVSNEELTSSSLEKEDQVKESQTKGPVKNAIAMDDYEIVDNSVLFLIAGYDTTSTALAFITHFLIHYPEVQEKIRSEIQDVLEREGSLDYSSVQEMKYMDQVMMESLRMYPPVYLFVNRDAEEDVQYGKYRIQKGISIQIPVYYMNRDPDLWPNPNKFDPSRFLPENKANINAMAFQTFGAGPRNCVGMRFAQLEIKLALSNILNKYRLIPTNETDGDPLTLKIGPASINPAKGIKLKAVPL